MKKQDTDNNYLNSRYRFSHIGKSKSKSYTDQFDDKTNIKHLYWRLEQHILSDIFAEYKINRTKYLDFACGSGRIINFLENEFKHSYGIDVSKHMIAVAKKHSLNSFFVQGDVTKGDFVVDTAKYDLITSFRFFLNAEPSLREDVLKWIYRHLRKDGFLICNFHLNPTSLIGSYTSLYSAVQSRRNKSNSISLKQAITLLTDANFSVLKAYHYGYLFYRRSGIRLSCDLLFSLEICLRKLLRNAPVARNFIVVALKK